MLAVTYVKIISAFDYFYISYQYDKLKRLSQLDISAFYWKAKGRSIQNFIKRQSHTDSLDGLIRLYFNLQENYGFELKGFSAEFDKLLKESSAKAIIDIKKNLNLLNELEILFRRWMSERRIDNEEMDLEEQIEHDESEAEPAQFDFDELLFQKLKTLIRKRALMIYDQAPRLSEKEKAFEEMIFSVFNPIHLSNFDKIGQLALFIKYFERSTKGLIPNLVSEIPLLYKAFRKKENQAKNNHWNFKLLNHIVREESEKNKRIHSEEQAFLIYFINNFVRKTYKISKTKADQISHAYFDSFTEFSKPIIGIDEATDFHLIDLLCMQSFADTDISSITFSGDLMQRLTEVGLRNWDDLKLFIPQMEVKELQISYRQSPTLLSIAQEIYSRGMGRTPEYLSFMDKDEKEPSPLLFINHDENKTIEWMADRILEIYKAYGNSIPSIAVFLADESQLAIFANRLGEIDRLADVDIKVKACNNGLVLGDSNTVRVFSIAFIKGLEFEAVFFHNIDHIFKVSDSETMLKNLYVGLSRATFYLGITSRNKIEGLKFLYPFFSDEKSNWRL